MTKDNGVWQRRGRNRKVGTVVFKKKAQMWWRRADA